MTRRNYVWSAVAGTVAAAALVLSGCSADTASEKVESKTETSSSAAQSGSAEAGRGPITFAMGKNDTDKLVPVIEKWNAAHPDEQVTLKELAGEADAQRDTLVQSLQAKKGDYDVMALDVVWTADFAAHQWLAPLEGELAVDTSKLLAPTVASATYGGTLYALPQNTNGQLLFRNTKLVNEAPADWAELANSCEAVVAGGKDCLITQLKQYEGLTVNTSDFIHAWGGAVVGPDGKTPKVEDPEAVAGLKALVDAYNNKVISANSISATEEETNLAFVGGEVAYAINWPYMYTNAAKDDSAVKDDFEVGPLLGPGGVGVSTLGGYNNGINVYSEHKATARDFIEFIVNEENQKSFAENSFPPVLASIYEDPALVEEYPYLPALKMSLENAQPRPVSPFYPAISKAIQDNATAALKGEKSPEDAAKDMAAAIAAAAK